MKRLIIAFLLIYGLSVFGQSYIYDDTVAYNWIDIKPVATTVTWDNTCTYYYDDDDKVEVNIGFTFKFGNLSYTQVRIITNGLLQFDAETGLQRLWTNDCLPSTSLPSNIPRCARDRSDYIVAGYWDDLDPSSGGSVYYATIGTAPDRMFVVTWENVPDFYTATSAYTFQIILYEKTGDIKFQYKSADCTGSSATIGVEINDADYTEYSCNTSSVGAGRAILFCNTYYPCADYHFDECYPEDGEPDILDSSGREFNGTIHDCSTIDDGVVCRSVDFTQNSTTDSVTLPETVLDGANNLSVSFWIKTTYTGAQAIVSCNNASQDNEFLIYFSSSTRLYVFIKGTFRYTTIDDIADGVWHHFVITRYNDEIRFYQDGILLAARTGAPTGALQIDAGGFYVGQEQDSVGGNFNIFQDCQGYIDELIFYRRAISDLEVQSIYNNQSAGKNYDGTSRECNNCSPIADWHLDECFWTGALGEVLDSSGNNYNGTANGDARTDDAKVCFGGVFDGNGDYIVIPSNTDLEPTKTLSFTAWIKKTDANTTGLQNIFTNGAWYRALRLSNNNVLFQLSIDGTVQYLYSSSTITDTDWHFIVATYNGREMKLYIDGNLDNSLTVSGTLDVGGGDHLIGSEYGGYYFNGMIDEVTVFKTSLSSTKIQEIYNNYISGVNWDGSTRFCIPCSPDIEYRMDECIWDGTANEIEDSSGNGHHGQGQNGASIETNDTVICRAGDLTGDNYGIITGAGYTLSIPYTTTCWIKFPLNAPAPHSPYYVLGSINGDGDLVVFYNSGTTVRWGIWNQNRQWANNVLGDNLTGWHHIAVVQDSSGARMYLDGNYVNSVGIYSIGALYYLFTSSDDVNGQTMGTLLDEFKIYGYALTSSQINYIYQQELNGFNYDGSARTCNPCSQVSYFEITHDGSGIACYPEAIHIRACDAGGNTVTDYVGVITLSTSTGNGTWYASYSGVTNNDPPQGTLTDNTADDGAATYEFVSADGGEVTLLLKDTHIETLTIYVTDGISDSTGHDGGPLTFAASGFVFDTVSNQISGKDFQVTVKAVGLDPQTGDCTIIDYDGAKNLVAYLNYSNPSTGTTNILINGTSVSSSGTAITLTFNSGVCTFTSNYPDAGEISIRLDDTAENITGTSNLFVVKPFGFYVSATGNPAAADASGAVYKQAGEAFELTVSAVNWQSADDTNNDGIPDAGADLSDNSVTPNYSGTPTLTSTLVAPSGGANGTLNPLSVTVSGGSGSETGMTFSEVGIINITATDSDYLGAGSITGETGNVGRFIPASFRFDTLNQNPACSSVFTYGGQNFTLDVTITALNTNGDTTLNYTGTFAKLDNTGFTFTPMVNTTTGGDGTLSAGSFSLTFSNGTASFTVPFVYDWANEHNPENISVKTTATDSDGVTGEGFSNYVTFKYGRLRIENGFSPSDRDLTLNVFAEYYQDGNYLLNTDDNCTTYSDTDVTLSNYQGNLNAGETSVISVNVISSGQGSLTLSAPGKGNEGSVDLIFTAPSYMRFAFGRATFGIYRGNDDIISWEEVF